MKQNKIKSETNDHNEEEFSYDQTIENIKPGLSFTKWLFNAIKEKIRGQTYFKIEKIL